MGFLGVRVWPRAKKNHHNVSVNQWKARTRCKGWSYMWFGHLSTVIKSNFEVVFPFYAALYFDSTTSRRQILSFGLNFLKMNELLKNHLVLAESASSQSWKQLSFFYFLQFRGPQIALIGHYKYIMILQNMMHCCRSVFLKLFTPSTTSRKYSALQILTIMTDVKLFDWYIVDCCWIDSRTRDYLVEKRFYWSARLFLKYFLFGATI